MRGTLVKDVCIRLALVIALVVPSLATASWPSELVAKGKAQPNADARSVTPGNVRLRWGAATPATTTTTRQAHKAVQANEQPSKPRAHDERWYQSLAGQIATGVAVSSLLVALAYSPYLGSAEFYPCPNPEVKCTVDSNNIIYSTYLSEANARAEEHKSGQLVGVLSATGFLLAGGLAAYFFLTHEVRHELAWSSASARGGVAVLSLPPVGFGSQRVSFRLAN